jgi:hypothetical protein
MTIRKRIVTPPAPTSRIMPSSKERRYLDRVTGADRDRTVHGLGGMVHDLSSPGDLAHPVTVLLNLDCQGLTLVDTRMVEHDGQPCLVQVRDTDKQITLIAIL